ncbi:hypothetical protein Psuf_049250 [Phytohabitans suffuscus]|uniref:Uncharacterized protein n=1 Tax=Phytohabitans suffuscus TaxID=624315 RepID=A0A6F8YNB1_9ACTN|nr:hypothetical protein Psuf_049250 [Phytohabitans suffuscus]
MQAGRDRAARVAGGQRAELVTGGHRLPGADGRLQRLVGGAQSARMGDADDAPPGDATGEVDGAGGRRAHRHAGLSRQVDAAVAGQPGTRRRVEAPDHVRRPVQRPTERTGRDRRRGASPAESHSSRPDRHTPRPPGPRPDRHSPRRDRHSPRPDRHGPRRDRPRRERGHRPDRGHGASSDRRHSASLDRGHSASPDRGHSASLGEGGGGRVTHQGQHDHKERHQRVHEGSVGRTREEDNRAAATLWMAGPAVDNARKARRSAMG